MKERISEFETTSRRGILKWAATAGLAAPFLTFLGCNTEPDRNAKNANNNTAPTSTPEFVPPKDPTSKEFGPSGIRTHLPPIIIGTKASMELEALNKLDTAPSNTLPPFIYKEDPSLPANDRYQALVEVRVITEIPSHPYVTDISYYGLPPQSQLLIWYQKIRGNATPGPDCEFENTVYNPINPDVRIKGATSSETFSVTLKHKKFDLSSNSHKCSRPFRYKQENIPSFGRFFRIGQWRIVGADGITAVQDASGRIFEDSGDDAYTILASFH